MVFGFLGGTRARPALCLGDCGLFRGHARVCARLRDLGPRNRGGKAVEVSLDTLIAGLLVVALLIYLIYTLLRPEKF